MLGDERRVSNRMSQKIDVLVFDTSIGSVWLAMWMNGWK